MSSTRCSLSMASNFDGGFYLLGIGADYLVGPRRYCDEFVMVYVLCACMYVCVCLGWYVGGCLGVWVCNPDRNNLKLGT